MSNIKHGPSRYYASDKNLFDALNQHKVDAGTISKLFLSRNIITSPRTRREELADHFSRLNHDYYDHKEIASKLGVLARRERITSMVVSGSFTNDDLSNSIRDLKDELESLGDTVNVTKNGDSYSLSIEYSVIDYRRSEFTQIQNRDGTIEIASNGSTSVVRNTKNDYLDNARDSLLAKLSTNSGSKIDKSEISLFDVTDKKLRSKFFYELAFNLPGYSLRDVTSAYVFRESPENNDTDDEDEVDTLVQRVHLGGRGITRSDLLNSLIDGDHYYIVKMTWRSRQVLGSGDEHEIEAVFTNPESCTGFSYILSGVYSRDKGTGRISSKRRAPTRQEISEFSKILERQSEEALATVKEDFKGPSA